MVYDKIKSLCFINMAASYNPSAARLDSIEATAIAKPPKLTTTADYLLPFGFLCFFSSPGDVSVKRFQFVQIR
jgi:hypothetical protein